MSDELVVAYHEAGHALAEVVMGFPAGLVSVEPKKRWLGVHDTQVKLAGVEPPFPGTPLACIPAAALRPLAAGCLAALAGPAAESFVPPTPAGGYRPVPITERLGGGVPLTAADRQFLLRGDEDETLRNDVWRALEYAEILVGAELAPAFAAYQAREAQQLLQLHRRPLARLAGALMASRTLTAAAVAGVLGGR